MRIRYAVLVMGFVAGLAVAGEKAQPTRPDLSGEWRLNQAKSDDTHAVWAEALARRRERAASQGPMGGGGPTGGGPMGGGPMGGPMGGGPMGGPMGGGPMGGGPMEAMTPPSREQMLARQLVVAEAMTPTRRLAIQQTATEVTVASELRERTFPIDGAVVKDGQGDAVIKRRVEWRKDGLVLATEMLALRTRQTLRLQPDGALEVQTQVEDRIFDKPIKVRRVYERARAGEAMPAGSPQPDASDSFRLPAPPSLDEPPPPK